MSTQLPRILQEEGSSEFDTAGFETPIIILVIVISVPCLAICTSLWMYRKSLPGMLPDFKRGVKASSREHAAFKQQEEQKIRQAQADEKLREAAGELKDLESPETSAWANVPTLDAAYLDDADGALEIRSALTGQSSNDSLGTTSPTGTSLRRSGSRMRAGSKTSARSTSKQSVQRSGSKQSVQRSGSKQSVQRSGSTQSVQKSQSQKAASTRLEPPDERSTRSGSKGRSASKSNKPLQRGRSFSEGNLQQPQGKTLRDQVEALGQTTRSANQLLPPGYVPMSEGSH